MSWSFTIYGRNRSKLAAEAERLMRSTVAGEPEETKATVSRRIDFAAESIISLLLCFGNDLPLDRDTVFKVESFGHVNAESPPFNSGFVHTLSVKVECLPSPPEGVVLVE